MNPLIIPASTAATVLAGSATTIIVWLAKEFGSVEIPEYVSGAITTLAAAIACHFTVDSPPAHPAASPAMVAAIERQEEQKP